MTDQKYTIETFKKMCIQAANHVKQFNCESWTSDTPLETIRRVVIGNIISEMGAFISRKVSQEELGKTRLPSANEQLSADEKLTNIREQDIVNFARNNWNGSYFPEPEIKTIITETIDEVVEVWYKKLNELTKH